MYMSVFHRLGRCVHSDNLVFFKYYDFSAKTCLTLFVDHPVYKFSVVIYACGSNCALIILTLFVLLIRPLLSRLSTDGHPTRLFNTIPPPHTRIHCLCTRLSSVRIGFNHSSVGLLLVPFLFMPPLFYRFVSPAHTADGTFSNVVPFFVSAIEIARPIPHIVFIRSGYIYSIVLFSLFTLPPTRLGPVGVTTAHLIRLS